MWLPYLPVNSLEKSSNNVSVSYESHNIIIEIYVFLVGPKKSADQVGENGKSEILILIEY